MTTRGLSCCEAHLSAPFSFCFFSRSRSCYSWFTHGGPSSCQQGFQPGSVHQGTPATLDSYVWSWPFAFFCAIVITCLQAKKYPICRKMQTLIEIKMDRGGRRRGGSMYPRRGPEDMLCFSLCTEKLRSPGAKVLCLKWSYRQKHSGTVTSPSQW